MRNMDIFVKEHIKHPGEQKLPHHGKVAPTQMNMSRFPDKPESKSDKKD